METVLIIGGGGREHALGWKLSQSPHVEKIFFALGNAGTESIGTNVQIDLSNHSSVIEWVSANNVSFVVVTPDDFLAGGMVDSLTHAGITCFGPTRAAAKIEWSKAYAKEVMTSAGIPTARYASFSNFEAAKEYILEHPVPIVIKASGLALGKGVVIAHDRDTALETLEEFMFGGIHGDAGKEVVIEEFMEGVEFSTHAFVDGATISMFPPSQDHKRIYDGDKGPNTGGMGTVAPLPWISQDDIAHVQKVIVEPLINELKKRGIVYRGLLYPGLMMTHDGPKVVEFNARFGDPETQSYMRLLESDLFEIMQSCAEETLADQKILWKEKTSAACIVMASGGYPGAYEKEKEIHGLDDETEDGVVIFQAGTKRDTRGRIVTSGGRVLNVTAIGENLQEALSSAYRSVENISFEGAQYRSDIGKKSL